MVEGDLFREVESELRQERLRNLWKRYGVYIVAGAVAVVAAVAGFKGWQAYSAKKAGEVGAEFERAILLQTDGKNDEARAIFEKLRTQGHSGYQLLAGLRVAADLAKSGKTEEAVKSYEALAESAGKDDALKGFARLRAAMLRVDTADWTEMQNRLNDLIGEENSWRHSARELLGLSAYRNGKKNEAQRIFAQILRDSAASRSLRERAQVMLALIVEAPGAGDSGAGSSPGSASAAPETQGGAPEGSGAATGD